LFNKREEEGKANRDLSRRNGGIIHLSAFSSRNPYLLQGRAEVAHMLESMSRKMR
jgi:hypothetical protein